MPLSPRTLRPANNFTPRSISGLALWLDASDTTSTYTTDAGPVTAVSSPLDISGCVGWWDASDAASITQSGGLVSQWNDKSGQNNHATASGSARPTLTAGGLNGRSVMTFDGSANAMTVAANSAFNSSDLTYFIVFRQASAANKGVYTKLSATAGTLGFGFVVRSDPQIWMLQKNAGSAQVLTSTANPTTQARVYSVTSSTSATGHLDGVTAAAASGQSADHSLNQAVTIGARASSEYLNGYIAEIIHFNTALSTADRARVEAYLAQRWGISGVHAQATASSDPVGYWADKSGNARHLTQATSASRPTFLPTGISSKPCLNFDGTDDTIWRQPGLTSDDLSILLVHQTNTLSGGITYEFTHQGDVTNAQSVAGTGFQNVAGLQVSATGSPAYMCDIQRSFANVDTQGRSGTAGDITANVPVIGTQCVSYSANTSAIRKQAWTSGKGMPNSVRFNCGGWSAITLGARRNSLSTGGINSPTVFLNGRIAEVVAYSRYISDADRRRLELYLARKWNVTLAGAPTVSHPEAQDWIDRVYGNGGTVSSSTASAANDFCNSIDAAGIRDRFYRLNIFAGTGLNACLVPLYLGPTSRGIRYGNTTDTNVGPFVSGDYSEGAGLQSLASTKYLNTGLATDAMPASVYESMHLSAWHGPTQSTVSSPQLLGVYNGTTDRWSISIGVSTSSALSDQARLGKANALSSTTTIQGSRPSAFLLATRTSATNLVLYRNAVSDGVLSTSVTGIASSNLPFYVFRTNLSGTDFGDPGVYAMRMYSIGDDMTQQQVASFHAALSAFNTALGRTA
jgi:hypothetical protein